MNILKGNYNPETKSFNGGDHARGWWASKMIGLNKCFGKTLEERAKVVRELIGAV